MPISFGFLWRRNGSRNFRNLFPTQLLSLPVSGVYVSAYARTYAQKAYIFPPDFCPSSPLFVLLTSLLRKLNAERKEKYPFAVKIHTWPGKAINNIRKTIRFRASSVRQSVKFFELTFRAHIHS